MAKRRVPGPSKTFCLFGAHVQFFSPERIQAIREVLEDKKVLTKRDTLITSGKKLIGTRVVQILINEKDPPFAIEIVSRNFEDEAVKQELEISTAQLELKLLLNNFNY